MAKTTKEIFSDVIDAVAVVYRLESAQLLSDCRKRINSEARQMAMYILYHDFNFQTYILGGLFLRGKVTVQREVKCFGESLEVMKDLQYKYITIKDILNL